MISSVIRTCFPAAAKVVADRAEEINKLNVFPVPDGDTGTNMSLTLNTVVREVEELARSCAASPRVSATPRTRRTSRPRTSPTPSVAA